MSEREEIRESAFVRPGDTLLVRTSRSLSFAQAEDYRDRLAEALPGVSVRVVCADDMLVYRPDVDDE